MNKPIKDVQLGEHDQQDLKQLQPQTCLRRGFGRQAHTDALKIGLGQVSEGFRQDVLIPFTLPRTIYDLLAQAAQSGQLHCEANEERRGQGNQETGLLVSCFDDSRIGLSELWSCVS